jgi:DNA-binding response OmpR family regulator
VLKKARILIVDDERSLRELLRLHLQNEGYEVVEAPDAIAAGRLLLEDRSIDLLIVDAHMPYMTGIEFAATVIADTTLPPLPIILITGRTDLADRADLLDVPCLVKPFSADMLISVVEKCISVPAAAAGLRERRMTRLSAYEGRQRHA